MKKAKMRILSWFLCVCLVLCSVPTPAFAVGTNDIVDVAEEQEESEDANEAEESEDDLEDTEIADDSEEESEDADEAEESEDDLEDTEIADDSEEESEDADEAEESEDDLEDTEIADDSEEESGDADEAEESEDDLEDVEITDDSEEELESADETEESKEDLEDVDETKESEEALEDVTAAEELKDVIEEVQEDEEEDLAFVLKLMQDLKTNYYQEYDGEFWILFETLLATKEPNELLAIYEETHIAMDAYEELSEEDKAEVDVEYAEIIDFMNQYAAAIAEMMNTPETMEMKAGSIFDTAVSGEYYQIISEKDYDLIPGATETEIILNNAEGSDRKAVHVFTVDTLDENVEIVPGYYMIDKFAEDPTNVAYQNDAKVTDMAEYYEENLGYDIVGGMNTSLAYDCDAPYSFLMYKGVVLQDKNFSFVEKNEENAWLNQHSESCQTYLAIDQEGNCELRSSSEPFEETDWTVISANFGWLVKDGKLTTTTVNRTSSDASRSMLGIKEDGTLVICQVDGRNAPVSTGLSDYEMGEMMLSLGCEWAVNGDGGGSSTFISQRAGEDDLTMRSVPSDGSERPTLHAIFIARSESSIATGILKDVEVHAPVIEDTTNEYEYFAPGSSVQFSLLAKDTHGFEMDVPADAEWKLSDDAFGSITADGVFTASEMIGDVDIQLWYQGAVVGSKTIHVAHPVVAEFAQSETGLPYGKSTEMEMNVWYDAAGEFPLYHGVDTFKWTVSDEEAGELKGMSFTATKDESITSVVITAEYAYNDGETVNLPEATYIITFGKGSEIIFDFEDGDLAGFMGFDDAKAWSIENGVENTLVGSKPLNGQYSIEVDGHTEIVTAEDGQVHNGTYALAWTLDNTEADFGSWTYNILFNTGDPVVLRDVKNGMNATKLGMWLYIPEGAPGLAFQSQMYTEGADGTLSCKQDHFTFTTVDGSVKNLNSCKESDIPESRWVYASINLSAYDYLQTADPYDESNNRSPSFIRTYVKPDNPDVLTFYIDDITLDYSAAVDDREAPVISNAAYVPYDEDVDFDTVATTTTMNFSATVADYSASNMSGLDYSTAMIYVDGRALDNVSASRNTISTNSAVTLSVGEHAITFEIADKMGNMSELTKTLTIEVEGETALISIGGHNDGDNTPEAGSIYYVDINTSDVSQVGAVYAKIQLNTANTWEIDNMSVLHGFDVEDCYVINSSDLENAISTYSIHDMENVLYIHLVKNQEASYTGEQTIASIPVRVWSWDGVDHVTGEDQEALSSPIVTIDYEVLEGYVVTDLSSGDGESFGGSVSVATSMISTGTGNLSMIHTHTEETLANQEATCTVDGYIGRTYCSECQSVVEWGTKIEALGHDYQISGGKLVCSNPGCGAEMGGTGVITVGDKKYYMIAGVFQTGWQSFGADGYCYVDPTTKEVYVDCEFVVDGLTYTADEDGLMLGGAWDENFIGRRYSYGPGYYTRTFQTIDGDEYYFAEYTGYALTGYQTITENRNDPNAKVRWYHFAEDGKLIERMTMTGVLDTGEGLFYMEDGCVTFAGMVQVGDDYYCAADKYGTVLTGRQYVGSYIMQNSQNPMERGYYEFGEDGKMLQGIVVKDDGTYYFEMGQPVAAGWVKDGDDYYVFGTDGKALTGTQWVGTYLTQTSKDPYKAGTFVFDLDGKLANGVVETDTGWYYCQSGVNKQAGLVSIDGAYYYAGESGQLASGRIWVGTYASNGLLERGYYEFGEDGKMLDDVVEKDDGVYYYEVGNPVDTGWLKVGDDYYVFTNGGKALTGTQWVGTYLTQTSRDPYMKGTFFFTEDGKLANGVTQQDDSLCYYKNGVAKAAGLVYLDGDYYLAEDAGQVATGRVWVGTYASNGLMERGYYEFGEDGKMLQGVVEKEDDLYYYNLGRTEYMGLIERDGEYYYVNTDGKLELGRVWVGTYASNGLISKGYYEFGEDGAMLNGFEQLEDGLYYYDMGTTKYIGLKIIDNDLYYINEGGKVETGRVWVGTYASNGLIPKGYYTFDDDGKFIK